MPGKADGEARSRWQKRIVKGRSDPFAFAAEPMTATSRAESISRLFPALTAEPALSEAVFFASSDLKLQISTSSKPILPLKAMVDDKSITSTRGRIVKGRFDPFAFLVKELSFLRLKEFAFLCLTTMSFNNRGPKKTPIYIYFS